MLFELKDFLAWMRELILVCVLGAVHYHVLKSSSVLENDLF